MCGFEKSRFTVEVPVGENGGGGGMLALYHTLSRALVVVPRDAWTDLSERGFEDGGEEVLALRSQGFLVPLGANERAVFETWRQQMVHSYDCVKSQVLVTRRCNNRCVYCIVDPEAGEMTSETALKMDRFYLDFLKTRKPAQVRDAFSGGEAFLKTDIILEVVARRFFFCEGRGIDYQFGIISNGTLVNREALLKLREFGMNQLRVSIAGPQEVHDRLRPSAGGEGTYDRILRNLEAVSGIVPIHIECQYDSASEEHRRLPEMMDDFERRGIGIHTVAFTPIVARRNETRFTNGFGDVDVYLGLLIEAEARGYPQFDEPPTNGCMADYQARLSFDTDGTLVSCPILQSGQFAYGNAGSGIDFVARSQMLNRNYADTCLDECEFLPLCLGGCRMQALNHTGDFAGVDCHREMFGRVLQEYVRRQVASAAIH